VKSKQEKKKKKRRKTNGCVKSKKEKINEKEEKQMCVLCGVSSFWISLSSLLLLASCYYCFVFTLHRGE
jgi:hypothetical protein